MKRKNTLWLASTCLLMLFIYSSKTYAQTYQWAKPASGPGFDYGNGIITDDSGNVYVSGQFEYDCNFGTKTVSTAGQHDIFIAKYNSAGTLKWVKRAGGTDGDAGSGIGIDAARNLYQAGEFEKTTFWTTNDSATVGGSNINNIYLSKYDNNGNFLWVKNMLSNGDSRGKALVTDSAGNSYFTGSFSRNCAFGSINLTYSGNSDAFLAKFDKDGNAIWAKKAGGSSDDKGKGVALDGMGNVFLCATFTNSANISGHTVTATGKYDSFIVKYDTAGVYKWSVKAGGVDTTKISAITTDNLGNCYVTGYFIDTATFGTTTLYSLGSYEFFIAKYDADGNFVWAKRGGGANEDFGQGISYDSRRNLIYVTGQFDYMANFDGQAVTSAGNRDIFISCWDTSGSIQWIKTGGGTQRDAGYAVANDTLGNVVATGFMDVAGSFGSYNITGDSLADIFVTKIAPPFAVQPSTASSNVTANVTNCTDINLNWTTGNGVYRMVIAKSGSAVSAFPTDGSSYTANAAFGSGSYLGSGCYVVYSGSGNACTVTGMTAGTRYFFAVIEFNGSGILSNYNTTTYPVANIVANSFTVSGSSLPTSICPGSSTVLTASGGVSYTWSPSTGLSATTGSQVTATLNTSITYTITATDGNGCNATTTLPVTVNPLPTVTQSSFTDACITTTAVTLIGGSPSGGTYSGSFVNAGIFNPSTAGTGSHNITYSYTDGNGCSNTATASLNVRALPVVTVNTQNGICINASPIALTGGSPAGGTYSGSGITSGSFDPAVTGAGTQIFTYTYADAFGCGSSDTATIQVNALPGITLTSFTSLCQNATSFVLTGGSPAGGTYSGTGVVSGSFYPNVAGAGTHTITYQYADANGCSSNATNTITVNALPVVTLGSFNPMCQNATALTLTGGSPAGGTYSGSGVSNGIFTPSSVGNNTVIYNYTDANGCSSFASTAITVNSLPTVSITPMSPVCQNSGTFALTGGSPAGGTWTGSNVSAGNFNPVTSGSNMVIYNYTNANGCTNFATTSITVNAAPVVTASAINGVCAGSSSFTLTGGNPAGGTWSGTNVSAGTFSPVTTGSNTVTYSYTGGNGCSGSASTNIMVYTLPTVTFATLADLCTGSSPLTLTGGSPAGGTYSGTNVNAGTFTVGTAGNYPIQYNYSDVHGCAGNANSSITVNQSPVVSLGMDTTICMYSNIVLNAGGGSTNYLWSTGATTQMIMADTTGSGIGTGTFTVTVTNAVNCSASDNINITFDICASVAQVSEQPPLGVVYPNPFGNEFTIFTDASELGVQITFSDVLGNIILKKTLTSATETLYPEVNAGIYFLTIQKGKTNTTIKLVKTN
ncbi:MAG: T9SS type A sorting domain-containing protein [Bacteroidota bacterium]